MSYLKLSLIVLLASCSLTRSHALSDGIVIDDIETILTKLHAFKKREEEKVEKAHVVLELLEKGFSNCKHETGQDKGLFIYSLATISRLCHIIPGTTMTDLLQTVKTDESGVAQIIYYDRNPNLYNPEAHIQPLNAVDIAQAQEAFHANKDKNCAPCQAFLAFLMQQQAKVLNN